MPENSFDIVSVIEMPEVVNAINQASKEIITRYDLKDSKSEILLVEKDKKITLTSKDEFKLKAVVEILEGKLVKRKVPLKGLQYGEVQQAAGHADAAARQVAAGGGKTAEGGLDRLEREVQGEDGAHIGFGEERDHRRLRPPRRRAAAGRGPRAAAAK